MGDSEKLVMVIVILSLAGLFLLTDLNLTGKSIESQATYYIDNCAPIASSGNYILNRSINATGTCLNITSSNVVLDCNNLDIYYAEGANGFGVEISGNANDVAINNCNIIKNTTFGNNSYGISIAGSTSVVKVYNSRIAINGERNNYGVYALAGSSGITLQNLTISTNGTGTANYGIYLVSTNNDILNSTISTKGTTANYGIYLNDAPTTTVKGNTISTIGTTTNYGIYGAGTSNFVVVDSNYVNTYGTGTNYAVYFNTPDSEIISNNTLIANGTGASNHGVYLLSSTGNLILGNSISAGGTTTSHGIFLQGSYSSIKNNVISTRGTVSDAIRLASATASLADNNLSTQFAWVTLLTSSSALFNNTHFLTAQGHIFYREFNLSDSAINQTVLNISQNKAQVNSSIVSNLNRSAIIKLVNGSGPEILVDYNDDGVYEACISKCEVISFSSAELIFNVTGFTTYSSVSIVPNVTGLMPSPSILTFNASQTIEIGANVSDNFGIEKVEAQITLAGGSVNQKLTLANATTNKFNVSYSIPNQNGLYTVVINATDLNGLANSSEFTRFNVIGATAEPTEETKTNGGGGGSVASGKLSDKEDITTLLDITEEIAEKGSKTVTVKKSEKVKLSLLNQTHHITVSEILEDSVSLLIESDVQAATLKIGEEKTFDVDGDSTADLAIRLESIMNQTAVLAIKDLNWKLSEKGISVSKDSESRKRRDMTLWVIAGVVILIIFIAGIIRILSLNAKKKKAKILEHRNRR